MEPIHVSDTELMELFQVDDAGLLFVAPQIIDWRPLAARKIRLVIDLEGELDCGVPAIPNNLIYLYFPFDDHALPDLIKLNALGRLGSRHGASPACGPDPLRDGAESLAADSGRGPHASGHERGRAIGAVAGKSGRRPLQSDLLPPAPPWPT